MNQASSAAVTLDGLTRTYRSRAGSVHALRGVTHVFRRGTFTAIMGPSGSGKSTLMNLIGCLDTPTKGSYQLNGKEVAAMNDDDLARIRNEEIGFVFQTFNLLARATSLHNVELPLIYSGMAADSRLEKAKEALRHVDLERRMYHKPSELSGGLTRRSILAGLRMRSRWKASRSWPPLQMQEFQRLRFAPSATLRRSLFRST